MPVSTLDHYIAGRDMKASAMIALAKACGVRLEWLADGEGPMRAEGAVSIFSTLGIKSREQLARELTGDGVVARALNEALRLGIPMAWTLTSEIRHMVKLFRDVDLDILGKAIDDAKEFLVTRGLEPDGRTLAQMAAVTYDAEMQKRRHEAKKRAVEKVLGTEADQG